MPNALRSTTIEYANNGHAGAESMKRLLRSICWWPGLDNQSDERSLGCLSCQCNNNRTGTEPLRTTTMTNTPWHTVAIDFASTPTTEKLLNVYDEGSRKLFAERTRGETVKDAINVCKKIFDKYGTPSIVKSDNGPAFASGQMERQNAQYKSIIKLLEPL